MEDLKGVKIGMAGPNLPCLDFAGASKVQTILHELYNALQSGVYSGIAIVPAPYFGFKFGEVAKYYTTIGCCSVVAYPLTANNNTWVKLLESVQKFILSETPIYEAPIEAESTTKYVTALDNLRKQGVTVKDLDPAVRGQMAKAIEPWVNQKAQVYEHLGFLGKETFRRLIEVSIEKGKKPVHVYSID